MSEKNGAVVLSVASPVGVMMPAVPVGAGDSAHGFGENAVGVDITWAVNG